MKRLQDPDQSDIDILNILRREDGSLFRNKRNISVS